MVHNKVCMYVPWLKEPAGDLSPGRIQGLTDFYCHFTVYLGVKYYAASFNSLSATTVITSFFISSRINCK